MAHMKFFLRTCSRSLRRLWLALLVIFSGLPPGIVHAEDTLEAVMARMKPQTAVRISYRETRYLDLLNNPWHGSGYLYALPPDLMIKEQLQPQREVMAAGSTDLYYYDPVNDVRHHKAVDPDDALSLHVNAFQALINGNTSLLGDLYRLRFTAAARQWQVTLDSLSEEGDVPLTTILMSGKAAAPADRIDVFLADGDHSEYRLRRDAEGEQVKQHILQLYAEVKGHE